MNLAGIGSIPNPPPVPGCFQVFIGSDTEGTVIISCRIKAMSLGSGRWRTSRRILNESRHSETMLIGYFTGFGMKTPFQAGIRLTQHNGPIDCKAPKGRRTTGHPLPALKRLPKNPVLGLAASA
jgi:hypothetical protein